MSTASSETFGESGPMWSPLTRTQALRQFPVDPAERAAVQVVQGRRRHGRVHRTVKGERVQPARLADHRLDVAEGGAVVRTAQLQQQRVAVDGEHLRVRQAAGQPRRQGARPAPQVEDERRPGPAARHMLDHVRDDGEALLAVDRVPLLLVLPALHPPRRRHRVHTHSRPRPPYLAPLFCY
jgi:hypothetical protein